MLLSCRAATALNVVPRRGQVRANLKTIKHNLKQIKHNQKKEMQPNLKTIKRNQNPLYNRECPGHFGRFYFGYGKYSFWVMS